MVVCFSHFIFVIILVRSALFFTYFHSCTSAISLLFVIIKSMLLDPLMLWKVNISLSSFIIWRCLLASYSSRFSLVNLLFLSYQELNRELLSAAIKILVRFSNCSISSMLVNLFSICSSISMYILIAKMLFFRVLFPKLLSFFHVCVMSMAPILLFGITQVALFFSFPAVNILQVLPIPNALFGNSYVSCTYIMSGSSFLSSSSYFNLRISCAGGLFEVNTCYVNFS